jgi:phage-related baseplate assembly protein
METALDRLRNLPAPEFAPRDTASIKADLVARFEGITGRPLYPAQVESFMIDLMAYALANVGAAQQAGLIQNRALWAEGSHLDQLGVNVGTYRLEAQHARCEVSFALSEARATAVVVPLGTRVAAGGSLIFATTAELVVPAGDIAGVVDAEALSPGAAHNGLQLGQVQDILDPVAYVSSVTNTQISAGGSGVESDARLRGRIFGAFERITRGGSRRGYTELVMAAHPDIVDVAVIRPEPCYIQIFPLMVSGVAPDAIDEIILAYLDPETRIPMGDFVSLHKVAGHVFDVTMTLKVTPGYAASAQDQAEALISAQFDVWGQNLGAQIAPTALVEAVRAIPGVVGVTGPAFAFTDLPATSFAQLGELTLDVEEAPNV